MLACAVVVAIDTAFPGARSYWPFGTDPETSWWESSDPQAQLLDQAVYAGCGYSAVACMYAATASDDREDVLCNTCVATCAAGYLKKVGLRGDAYKCVSFNDFYTAGWCFQHKMVHYASNAISPIMRYLYHELPHMYQDICPYYNAAVQAILSKSPEAVRGIRVLSGCVGLAFMLWYLPVPIPW